MSTSSHVPFCAAAGALLSTLAAVRCQVQWNRLQTAHAPSTRSRVALAYDEARDRTVLFGGLTTATPLTLGDTWSFDGTDWAQATTGVAPAPRQWSMAVYDSWRQRVVLFGGMEFTSAPYPWRFHNDTWEWDGMAWNPRSPAASPPPRGDAGCAFDAARGRVVLFGGRWSNGTSTTNLDDTWEWDGTTWTQATPAVRPSARKGSLLFYDPSRQRVVLAGGSYDIGNGSPVYFAETWEWDGSNWTRLSPAATPAATNGESLAFDAARGRAVRYQGLVSGSVVEWDGGAWSTRSPAGVRPQDRMDFRMAYDSRRQRVVAFGGVALPVTVPLNDTWSYTPVHPATLRSFGAGCPGSAGVPQLQARGLPWLQDTVAGQVATVPAAGFAALFLGRSNSSFLSLPLPLDLGTSGAPGCSLLIALDAGVVLTATNGVAPWTLSIPGSPSLLGVPTYLQAMVFDLPANAAGVVLSEGLEVIPGSR